MNPPDEPLLLTPGPLTTTRFVKEAMLVDRGSRDAEFLAITARIRERLVRLVGGEERLTCVPVQGSGTFAVEAMLGTFVGPEDKVLIAINGSYGRRMAAICQAIGRPFTTIETDELEPLDPAKLRELLAADPAITHLATVYCETTSGLANPIEEIAAITAEAGRGFLLDAMSAFGALPLDRRVVPFTAVAASANKCLEGVPGVAFVLADREILAGRKGRSPSLSLDLHDQWSFLEKTGQWRFTPPTHVLAALDRALERLAEEGSIEARHRRYRQNEKTLVDGMRALGFETVLDDSIRAPIIVTFHEPRHERFEFRRFYDALRELGFVIYPGKVTQVDSFRIGCIGSIDETDVRRALDAIASVLRSMDVDLTAGSTTAS